MHDSQAFFYLLPALNSALDNLFGSIFLSKNCHILIFKRAKDQNKSSKYFFLIEGALKNL